MAGPVAGPPSGVLATVKGSAGRGEGKGSAGRRSGTNTARESAAETGFAAARNPTGRSTSSVPRTARVLRRAPGLALAAVLAAGGPLLVRAHGEEGGGR